MYLLNKSSKLEPVNRGFNVREKSQSLLDHPRISKVQAESGLISEQNWRPVTNCPPDVNSGKVQPVLHVPLSQRNTYSGSPGIQSKLMEPLSHSLCRNAHSSRVPEVVIQQSSVPETLTSSLNQQISVLTLCCSPAATSLMSV